MANENFTDHFIGVPYRSFRPLIRFGDSLTYVDTLLYSLHGDFENKPNQISTSLRVANYIDSKSEIFNEIVNKYWKDMLWTTSSASYENYNLSGNYNSRRLLFRLNGNVYLDATPNPTFDFDTNKRITFTDLAYAVPTLKTSADLTINDDPLFNCPIYWQFSDESALSNLNANLSSYSDRTLNLNFKQHDWASYYVDLDDGVKLDVSCMAHDVSGDIAFGSTSNSIQIRDGLNELTTALADNVLSFSNILSNNQIHRAKITECKAVVNNLIKTVYPSRNETIYAHPYDEYVLPARHGTPLNSISSNLTMPRSFQPGFRNWEINITYQPFNDGEIYSLVKTDSQRVINNETRPLLDVYAQNNCLYYFVYGVNIDPIYVCFHTFGEYDPVDIKIAFDFDTIKFYVKEKHDIQYKLVYFAQSQKIVDSDDNLYHNLRDVMQLQDNHLIFNSNNKANLISNVDILIDGKTFADMSNVSLDYGITVDDWGLADYQVAAFTPDLSSHKIYFDYVTSEETPTVTDRVLWYDWNSKSYKEYINGSWVSTNYVPVAIRSKENGVTTISYADWDSYKDDTVLIIDASDILTAGQYRLSFDDYSQTNTATFEFGQSKLVLENTPQLNYFDFQHDLRADKKYIFLKTEGTVELDCNSLKVIPLCEVPNGDFNDIPAFTSSWTKFYQEDNEQVTIKFDNPADTDTLTCLCQMTGDFDVCIDSQFGTTQGVFPAFKWNLTYGTQTKSISNFVQSYNANSFMVPFSSVSTVKNMDISLDSGVATRTGRLNNLSVYRSMVRNGAFYKQSDWYEDGDGYIDTAAGNARAIGTYTMYQTFDTSSINTGDKLFLYANIEDLQANQRVKVYLKDQVSEHTVTLLDTDVTSTHINKQYLTSSIYDGDPIVTNPLYLGAYRLNVTLDNVLQNDFILFDLTHTVWTRENKIWVDTEEVYDPIYGSTSYPTKIIHMNERYIGAFEDPSELPETTEIGNFAYVYVSVYVYEDVGWINVGYISALEDTYPRFTETTNPHYKGNGVVKVVNLDGSTPDFSNVYTDQFMDLNLNDTEIKYNGSKWIDTGNRIGTTPHNVDSNYNLFVEFTGSNVSTSAPIILNSLCVQNANSQPVYTSKNFKDIFSWNKNVFENNNLTFDGTSNTEIKLVNYVLKPNIEYTIGFNYTNCYAHGRIRFKFVTDDGTYTTTDWLTLGSASVGTGKIALGSLKLTAPSNVSRFVIEPDNAFTGNLDDLKVVVSNYLVVADDVISQTWQTLNDSYIPVNNNNWIIRNHKLMTNGSILPYSSTNKKSAAVCYLDSIVYNNTVHITMVVDSIVGQNSSIVVKAGDEQDYYSVNQAGTYNFDIDLGESASLMITVEGNRISAVISKFEVKLSSGTVQLNQDGYTTETSVQYTSGTTFNLMSNSVGSDIRGQQNRVVEIFQNDSDNTTTGTYVKGFYNSRTNQIEAIDWRQDGYVTDTALISYIASKNQTLNSTLLNQVFFDADKTLYISIERVIEQEEQPELKNNQVWYNPVNKKYFINILGELKQVQYLGYCATDNNRIVICRARSNRKKLSNPIKPFFNDNKANNTFSGTTNAINQNVWKKFLTEQNSYWHNRLFVDATGSNLPSSANLINVLTRAIPESYGTTYENWMDAGEIYYVGQDDDARNVYWDHESQCYRWKTNGDIVLAQLQKDSSNNLFFHNLYSDFTIIDKSMVLRRTAWKNENCNAQIYLIGGAGALTTDQSPVASSSYTTISSFNCKAYSGGTCVGGSTEGIYNNYNGLYQANSGKDMPLSVSIRMPNTGNIGWPALSTIPYGHGGTFNGSTTLTAEEAKCCRPSGGVVYMEEYLRRLIGKTFTIATGTTNHINGKANKGNDGAVIIIERWNS